METIKENQTEQVSRENGAGPAVRQYSYSMPQDPVRPADPPFVSRSSEVVCALLMYVAAYFYVMMYDGRWGSPELFLALTAAFIIGITEWLCRGINRSRESLVWLACFVCTVVSLVFDLSRVWGQDRILIFVHIFAVYWVLARSGKLMEGGSSHLLPADAVNGFVIIPFGHYFLRIRTLVWGIKNIRKEDRKLNREKAAWIVPTVIVCIGLFIAAAKLLIAADSGFGRLFGSLAEFFSLGIDGEDVLVFIFSLPVGSWLFGLISGSVRTSDENLEKKRGAISSLLDSIKKIPESVWVGVIGVFTVLYVAFFVMQSTYLFGAFAGKLPEGFIVSQYAREGFFELCKVMALNFALLWLVTRMADRVTAAVKTCCLVLLAESMLFAVIAFSKLMMYINCYGFTPLRFQSSWLVCVLFAGCALWAWSLVSGKKTIKIWMYFGALSLTALCFV